ncbi:Protein of unknown function, partial [Gryllus bimaculatus]
GLRRTKK